MESKSLAFGAGFMGLKRKSHDANRFGMSGVPKLEPYAPVGAFGKSDLVILTGQE